MLQVHIKLLKDGMKIEARHVRRKQLSQYLDPNLLKRERKNSDTGVVLALNTSTQNSGVPATTRKRPSSEIGQTATAMINKKARNSDSVSDPIPVRVK